MTATLIMVFGTPGVLKQSLAGSGAYDSFVDSALESAKKEQSKNTQDVPLDRPEVKAAVQSAFTPALLRTNSEQLIDATYGWLQGKTPTPIFRIDLTAARQNLISSLADYAANRAAGLPACSPQQTRELQGSDVDPFNAACLPPGITADTIRQKVAADLTSNNDFLKNPVYTEANFPRNSEGKTPFQQAEQAPKIYAKAKLAPYVLTLTALLAGVCVVLLYEERRCGLRSIGFSFLSVGIVVLFSTWLVSYALNRVEHSGKPLGNLAENNFQQALLTFVNKITATLNSKLYIFCFAYIVIGAGLLITLRLTRQKQPDLPETDGLPLKPEQKPASSSEQTDSKKPTN